MRSSFTLVLGILLLTASAASAQFPAETIPPEQQAGHAGTSTGGPTGALGLNLLQFDDGVISNGTGCNANPPGQVLMRFGASAATSGLVPFQLRGLYWQIYPGFEGNPSAVNVNVWYPLTAADGAPTNTATPAFQSAATTNTAAGFKSHLFAGPTITSAAGDVLAGVGVQATTAWFVAYESNSPSSRRFGACGSSIAFYLPGGANVLNDAHLRLLVDGNIPVELERFVVD